MKKYLIFLLLISLVSTFGCRSKDDTNQNKRYDGVELTYYKVFDDNAVIEPLINEYIAKHPGMKINFRKFSDFEEYLDTVVNEMAEGEGPDIFSMQNTWFASNMAKVTPMPESEGTIKDFENVFVDVAYKDLVRVDKDYKEKIFGLPMTVDSLALYYNKDQFEDKIPTVGMPSKTWEGIKNDISLLNKMGSGFSAFQVAGMAIGRADNISRAVDVLYLLFLQHGVNFYNDSMSQAIFAARQGAKSYPGLDALNLFVSFADSRQKHFSWDENMADRDSAEMEVKTFAEGKTSMIFGFSYTYDDIVKQIDALRAKGIKTIDKNAIRIAEVPQLYDPEESSEKRVTYASYFAETVSRNCKHPQEAWNFLVYMTSKDVLNKYFEQTNKPTSRRDMIEDQEKDPIYGVFASQIGYAESFPIVNYYLYKEAFTDVINQANKSGAYQSNLVEAQDLITQLLPPDGLIFKANDKSKTTIEKPKDTNPDLKSETTSE
ncbi:MAG: extracellular solute-binding protein [Candidatus Gracilibacteria bacterium]|jgi:multiple sugar transport system substrate-binding protein